MKHLFNNISREEKQRILEMHKNATNNNYLNEQEQEQDLGSKKGTSLSSTLQMRVDIKGTVKLLTLTKYLDHAEGVIFVGTYRGETEEEEFLFKCSDKKLFLMKTLGKIPVGISEKSRTKLAEDAKCTDYSSTDIPTDNTIA